MKKQRASVRERLVHHVQELERLEEEKRLASEDVKAAFTAAADDGFDRATLRVVLKLRKLSPSQRRERRALEAIYLASLGMLEGDALPEEARRRLDDRDQPPTSAPASAEHDEPVKSSEASDQKPKQLAMPLKDPSEARQEGRAAAAVGKRIYDNPYPAGDPCRAAWDEGWCEASGSHGMETPSAYQRRTEKPPDPPDAGEKEAA